MNKIRTKSLRKERDKSTSKSSLNHKTCKVVNGFILDIDLPQKIVNDKFYLTTNCDHTDDSI